MNRSLVVTLVIVTTGCVARAGGGYTTAGSGGSAPPPSVAASDGGYAPGEDAHWFSADDYLVAERAYEGKPLGGLTVAKMIRPPDEGTRGEAQFLTAGGDQLWSAHYFTTRVAFSADLGVGTLAFCRAHTYTRSADPPRRKHDARQRGWTVASVTDNADLFKQRATVGRTSCHVGAIRVLAR